MKSAVLFLMFVFLIFVAVSCQPKQTRAFAQPPGARDSGGLRANPASGGNDEPLLLLDDDEPPLLLDDGESTGPVADNSRCFVCHLNYMQEEIALVHARADIGCADCHGASDEHIADESWAEGGNGTAPDIMYPREKINPACMACHPKDKIDTEDHKAFFAGTVQGMVCTDCHGKHRLATRKCKWK